MPIQDRIKSSFATRLQLYKQIRHHVEIILGKESKALKQYRLAFEAEFKQSYRLVPRKQFEAELLSSDFIFLADFHALFQSQKSHLRILRKIQRSNKRPLVLAMECFFAEDQASLDLFMRGQLSEKDFLKKIGWSQFWGFPWEHYRAILKWAKKNSVPVYGLNSGQRGAESKSLSARDRFAAGVLEKLASRFSASQIAVIYGDWHIARKHLPELVQRKLKTRSQLLLFQNSEKIYFDLLKKGLDHQVDLVQLGRPSSQQKSYCLQNVPPWVKWQQYLLFLEQGSDVLLEDVREWTDDIVKYLRVLASDLQVSVSEADFEIYDALEDRFFEVVEALQPEARKKWFQTLLEEEVSFYFPDKKVGCLARPTVNHAASLAMQVLYSQLSQWSSYPSRFPEDFTRLIWLEAISYFGSKLINPKRKTDSIPDIRKALASRQPADRGREALRLALSQKLTELMRLSGGGKTQSEMVPRKLSSYREAARLLGGLLGEKLFSAVRSGRISARSLKGFLSKNLDEPQFSDIYFEILEHLEALPEPFQSKEDLL
jgi:hypothetical protein